MYRQLLLFFGLCFLLDAVDGQDGGDIWSSQLVEMKMMLTTLMSKVSALDNKMLQLNFLEYAFKVNSVDSNLAFIKESITDLDTRMTRLEAQTEDIKGMVTTIQRNTEVSCGVSPPEKETKHPLNHQRAGGEEFSCHDLTRKIEDYGFKIAKSQQELKDSGQRHQRTVGNLLDTVRNGFTKTFQKIDVLPNAERQLSRLSASISELPSQLPRVLGRLNAISENLLLMRSNMSTMLQHVSSGTGKSSDRTTAVLIHAVDIGNRLKTDLSKLLQTETDIVAAGKMAKDLLTGLDPRRPTSVETLTNLTNTLENLEDKIIPLFLSVPYKSDSIHELLESALASATKNETSVCNFKEVFNFELKRINDNIEKGGAGNCVAQPIDDFSVSESEKGQESSQPTKQQDVFENLVYVRAALSVVKKDLQQIFRKCPDGSVPTAKPLGMVMG